MTSEDEPDGRQHGAAGVEGARRVRRERDPRSGGSSTMITAMTRAWKTKAARQLIAG